jgi:hypothetical protein
MSQEIKNQVAQILEANNIKLVLEFVPFSKSYYKAEKYPSLNYKVFVFKGDRQILQTDYVMGCANCPGYKNFKPNSFNQNHVIKAECETGFEHNIFANQTLVKTKSAILPHAADVFYSLVLDSDVFYSLVLDSDVIEYSSFEDWAENFGYDADSRKAEKIYRDCLDIALKLKNGIGDAVLNELREALQDY